MTNPRIVFFGFDVDRRLTPKIFLRTLLYSTSVRGKMIEGMYVKLCRGATEQIFSFWGYGEAIKLSPGSGLYVGQTGVAANHHFVLSVHQPQYEFVAGKYSILVFARLVGKSSPIKLSEISVILTDKHAEALSRKEGVMFELLPDGHAYEGHIYNQS